MQAALTLGQTFAMFFVPVSRNIPMFGLDAAQKWLWSFTISPGFFGGGMIMGPEITLHMLTGAIVGWAFLSPLAKTQGWAPGPIDDWNTGSRGWIVWISLSALIADAIVKIGWICVQSLLDAHRSKVLSNFSIHAQKMMTWLRRENKYNYRYTGISGNGEGIDENEEPRDSGAGKPTPRVLKIYFLGLSFLVSVLICISATICVFWSKIPWHYALLSVLLALPMAVISIRTLGESDYNPQSGLGNDPISILLCSISYSEC
jgi:hypothetical protein